MHKYTFIVLGCEILAKAEFCNGGGSVKDRAALFLIKDAQEKGKVALVPRLAHLKDNSVHLICPYSVSLKSLGYGFLYSDDVW